MDVTLFNYNQVSLDEALEIRACAERVRSRLKRTTEDIIEIGRELSDVKSKLPHGSFLPWVESEFGMAERTARNFISVHSVYGGKSAIVADLNLNALYELAAPSTPEPVRELIEQKLDDGEKVTLADIRAEKYKVKTAQREAESAKKQVETLKIEAQSSKDEATRLKQDREAHIAKAKSDAETQAQQEIDQLSNKLRNVEEEHRAKVSELAQIEVNKLKAASKDELDKLKRQIAEKKSEQEHIGATLTRQHSLLKEMKESKSKIESVDYEIDWLLRETDELRKKQAIYMVTLADCEHWDAHPDKLQSVLASLADQCEKLGQVIEERYRPKLSVIDGDIANG
jgi:DNA repair exonuclease SbcCD ATPase subunit